MGPWPIHLFVTDDIEILQSLLKEHKHPEEFDPRGDNFNAIAFSWQGPNGLTSVVYYPIREDEQLGDIVNTCAHEATHIYQAVKRWTGEQDDGAEAQAYFVGYVTQAIFETVKG